VYVAKPKVMKVTCVRKCASRKRAQAGSTLKITGTGLASADEVVFHGSFGEGDDVSVHVNSGSDSRINANVPIGAVTGPLSVVTSGGGESKPTLAVAILPPPPPPPKPSLLYT
jgi:hypothetical protein